MDNIIISDNETFVRYIEEINNGEYQTLVNTVSTNSSIKYYGIFHESYGWLEYINLNLKDNSIKLKYTFDKSMSMSIKGKNLSGRILTYGQCILK